MDEPIGILWLDDFNTIVVGPVFDVAVYGFSYGCISTIAGLIIGIVLWAVVFLIYLYLRLIYEGFKALFQGKIWLSVLYWIVPVTLAYLAWTNGLGSFTIRTAAATSERPGTIRGYFAYPDENCCQGVLAPTKKCDVMDVTSDRWGEIVPEPLKERVIQHIHCRGMWSWTTDVDYFKFETPSDLQRYILMLKMNGYNYTYLTEEKRTNDGSLLIFDGIDDQNNTYETVLYTVDAHGLVLQIFQRYVNMGGDPMTLVSTYTQKRSP